MTDSLTSDIKKIYALYGAHLIGLIWSATPVMILSGLGNLILLAAMIAAYSAKKRAQSGGLLENHASYLIRTDWIFALLFVMGMVAAGAWIFQAGDLSAITAMADRIASGAGNADEAAIRATMDAYYAANIDLMIRVGLLTLSPAVLYIVIRLAHGLDRARKGYRVARGD